MKTSIDFDRELAAEVADILCTKTLKDTVDAALRDVLGIELRRELADSVLDGTLPVPTLEELARLRGHVA